MGKIDLNNTAKTSFDHGAKSSIGTSAVAISTLVASNGRGVRLKSSTSNASSSIIYVGNSDVTAGTADATDGFELTPGESVSIPFDKLSEVYVRGSTTGLRMCWINV